MIELKRTDAQNPEFAKLVQLLNSELAERDGASHPLSEFNSITDLKYVVLAFKGDMAVGCGAISRYSSETMEIKRMYVSAEVRGQRIGEKILSDLESWAQELGCNKCILFTGSRQPEANQLYQRNGYSQIPKYGQLKAIPDSICYTKELSQSKLQT